MMNKIFHLFIVLVILTILSSRVESAAVIGIDLGTEWLKVGLRKSGSPIDVVLNEQTKRKTSHMIGFRNEDRYFGEAARSMSTRFPDTMFRYLNLIIGKRFDEDSVKIQHRFNDLHIPISLIKNENRGTFNVRVDKSTVYTTEELFAMIFKYVKKMSSDNARGATPECVITVPPYFSANEKQAIMEAATIADLKVLSLMQEPTATALQYGLTKYRVIAERSEPLNVVFFDMGAHTIKVSAVSFSNDTTGKTMGLFEVKGAEWDAYLGGVDFDVVLANYFASEFKKKHGDDVTKMPRQMTRLMDAAKKTKEVLSANTETVATVESLYDDKDFMLAITRKNFEEMSKDLLKRVTLPLERLFKKIGISAKDIDAIELIGGSSRIPAVQEILKEFVGRDLGHSLNSDEAIALGSAFHATYLSPSFRVKSFKFKDVDTVSYPEPKKPANVTEESKSENKTEIPATTEKEQKEETAQVEQQPTIPKITEKELTEAKNKLVALEQRDKLKRDISAARNNLESMMYEYKYQTLQEEKYKPFYTEAESNSLIARVDETDEWLSSYDDSKLAIEVERAFIDKLNKIKQLAQPILDRYNQVQLREKAVTRCREVLSKAKSFESTFKTIYQHITEDEWKELASLVTETETWLNTTIAKQESTPLSQAPVAVSTEYVDKCATVTYKVAAIRQKPVPKPPAPEKKNETTTEQQGTSDSTKDEKEPAKASEEQPNTNEEDQVEQEDETKKDEL